MSYATIYEDANDDLVSSNDGAHAAVPDDLTGNVLQTLSSVPLHRQNDSDGHQPSRSGEFPLGNNLTTASLQFSNIDINSHNQLFETLILRAVYVYVRTFPLLTQRFIECLSLLFAFSSLCVFLHIHYSFINSPVTCLDHLMTHYNGSLRLRNNNYSILRIEILPNSLPDYNLSKSYEKERLLHTAESPLEGTSWDGVANDDVVDPLHAMVNSERNEEFHESSFNRQPGLNDVSFQNVAGEDNYIVEYSLEYGFLQLSPATRKKFNISVQLVTLFVDNNTCFGNVFTRLLLNEFLGFDDVLLASVRRLVEGNGNRGYMRNVVTGDHFSFVSSPNACFSYLSAFFTMIGFTLTLTIILRFSQQQIGGFIVGLLQMLDNVTASFLVAPACTVILALGCVETIMSGFFRDTTTAFYIILIVWIADQYNNICCHTGISRNYWYRFFYLYHYCFYAYHNRFYGQYNHLALLTSWLFTLHSMIFFFHHYELPVLMQFFLASRIRSTGTTAVLNAARSR